MLRSLLITVRFHEGRYHGQEDGFNGQGGWPPSPARLFQALVAGAAQGAQLSPEDQRALRWLERLDPPRIVAPAVRRGRAVNLFIPNNDLDSVGGNPARVNEIRVEKKWRPCFFDPQEPVLYVWDFELGAAEAEASRICSITGRLYQLGRGIDMAWAEGQVLDRNKVEAILESHPGTLRQPGESGSTAVPHPGTLDSLILRYQRKRERLTTVVEGRKSRQLFTQPPKASFRHTGYDTPAHRLHFELRGASGCFAPRPLASAASLVTGLRDMATARLSDALPHKSALFERVIIGRGSGPADFAQRIRLIPIPSVGASHTDPSIRRIMVEVPANCPVRLDDLRWAFAGIQPFDPSTGQIWSGSLVSTHDSRMADHFTRSGRVFCSITSVALPTAPRRRLEVSDRKTGEERGWEERRAAGALIQALRHVGIRTRPTDILVRKEPFHRRGVRAEKFADGSRFSKHVLWHVELRFHEAISGPLVIGDGRFCGLGLLQPLTSPTDVVVINLGENHRVARKDRAVVIGHLRRALMALARDDSGQVARLFSGHEPDGRSDSAGHHAHVFLAADAGDNKNESITRLIVAAPWAVDRQAKPYRNDRHLFGQVVHRLTELRAGCIGRFDHLKAEPPEEGDPLLGPAKVWIGRTPYMATRNLKKRDDPDAAVKIDVATECVRRGLPVPTEIEVLNVTVGPSGGRPTAKLKLRFAIAVRGPLLLGRDSHAGGGLFHALK